MTSGIRRLVGTGRFATSACRHPDCYTPLSAALSLVHPTINAGTTCAPSSSTIVARAVETGRHRRHDIRGVRLAIGPQRFNRRSWRSHRPRWSARAVRCGQRSRASAGANSIVAQSTRKRSFDPVSPGGVITLVPFNEIDATGTAVGRCVRQFRRPGGTQATDTCRPYMTPTSHGAPRTGTATDRVRRRETVIPTIVAGLHGTHNTVARPGARGEGIAGAYGASRGAG